MESGVKLNSMPFKTQQEAKFYLIEKKKDSCCPCKYEYWQFASCFDFFCTVKLHFEALGLFEVLQPMKPAALQNSISSTSLPDYQIYKNKHALGAVSATRLSMLPMQA